MTKKTEEPFLCPDTLRKYPFFVGSAGICGRKLASAVSVEAPEYVLMEPETGTVILEKDKDVPRSPAKCYKGYDSSSYFEEIRKRNLKLDEYGYNKRSCQIYGRLPGFLEEGEMQTVDTMIKCIAVASGNDAAVAMAEFIAGSEEEFVSRMNEKAQALGMNGTHFEDCCGLTDSDNHYTTARDVAAMSRELITRHPDVLITL